MRRLLAPLLALAFVASACSGDVVLRQQRPVSPAAVGLPGGDAAGSSVVGVVRRVLPAVVNVTTDQLQIDAAGGSEQGRGVGTGFIVAADGYVVTNFHVVEGAGRIRVTTSGADPHIYDARVIGGDQSADVAVLKVEADGLPVVAIGRSGRLQLGQRVVAIGYALALEGGPSVTAGIVSSLTRTIQAQDPNCRECDPPGVRTYSEVVQTDAAINPGNSGGPLVDLRGRVVGINSAGAGQAENIGFAIAMDHAWPIVRNAIENPDAPVSYLGVTSRSVDQTLAVQLGLEVDTGAYVIGVSPGGPAQSAGIRAGDVIVGFDGQPVGGSEELGGLIREHVPGDEVQVEIVSGAGVQTVTAVLDVNPLP